MWSVQAEVRIQFMEYNSLVSIWDTYIFCIHCQDTGALLHRVASLAKSLDRSRVGTVQDVASSVNNLMSCTMCLSVSQLHQDAVPWHPLLPINFSLCLLCPAFKQFLPTSCKLKQMVKINVGEMQNNYFAMPLKEIASICEMPCGGKSILYIYSLQQPLMSN